MTLSWHDLIAATHSSGHKAALAITGGGSGAISELLRVPGGSRLLLDAQVPYDEQALAGYLGFAPAQAASAGTAIALATAARRRAARLAPQLSPSGPELIGLGATAALVSDRPRRGEHRFHVAAASATGVAHCTAVLDKGRRDRAGEEDLVARCIVLWLARACGVDAPAPATLLEPGDSFTEGRDSGTDGIEQLAGGAVSRITVQPDGQVTLAAPVPQVLFPGSFNPMHRGHVALARIAEDVRQQPLAFEISVTNVDKPPLASDTIRRRAAQFAWRAPLELTRAPTFVEKSRLFPATTFVVGADTAERLVAARYYGDDEDRMRQALEEMGAAGNSFLVAVRIDPTGRLRGLDDVEVPPRYRDLFIPIPEDRFRFDASSTEIRARAAIPQR